MNKIKINNLSLKKLSAVDKYIGGTAENNVRARSTTFGGKSGELVFGEEALELLKAIRDDKKDTSWVCFGFDRENNDVPLVLGTGTKELDEAVPLLKDDNYAFIILQLSLKENQYGFVPKVIFITWIGPATPPIDKERSIRNHLLLKELINVCALFLYHFIQTFFFFKKKNRTYIINILIETHEYPRTIPFFQPGRD